MSPGKRKRKPRGKRIRVLNRLRVQAHRPPLPSILLANVQSLEKKLDFVRAGIRFQRDIRYSNIFCGWPRWYRIKSFVRPSLFSNQTGRKSQVNPRVEGYASWPTTSGATLRILRLFLIPARQTWSIWWSLAVHSIFSGSSARSLLQLSTSHPKLTPTWH